MYILFTVEALMRDLAKFPKNMFIDILIDNQEFAIIDKISFNGSNATIEVKTKGELDGNKKKDREKAARN